MHTQRTSMPLGHGSVWNDDETATPLLHPPDEKGVVSLRSLDRPTTTTTLYTPPERQNNDDRDSCMQALEAKPANGATTTTETIVQTTNVIRYERGGPATAAKKTTPVVQLQLHRHDRMDGCAPTQPVAPGERIEACACA